MEKILETERLILRKLVQEDYSDLCGILMDKEVMYAYEHAFDEREAHDWLDRQIMRYENDGFGLWAVILKENGEFIGQCGITMQEWGEKRVPEIGYLFRKEFWHKGYAIESASACKEYAFGELGITEIYSIIRENNIPSRKVAERNGMTVRGELTKHYYGMEMPHLVYGATKG